MKCERNVSLPICATCTDCTRWLWYRISCWQRNASCPRSIVFDCGSEACIVFLQWVVKSARWERTAFSPWIVQSISAWVAASPEHTQHPWRPWGPWRLRRTSRRRQRAVWPSTVMRYRSKQRTCQSNLSLNTAHCRGLSESKIKNGPDDLMNHSAEWNLTRLSLCIGWEWTDSEGWSYLVMVLLLK